jgi:hypothetical protein
VKWSEGTTLSLGAKSKTASSLILTWRGDFARLGRRCRMEHWKVLKEMMEKVEKVVALMMIENDDCDLKVILANIHNSKLLLERRDYGEMP